MRRLAIIFIAMLYACGQEGPAVPEAGDGSQGSGDSNSAGSIYQSKDPRLTALPSVLQQAVESCEASAHFYDLGAQKCTDIAPAPFTCAITDQLKALLDPTTIDPLDDYMKTKAADLTLYACTQDSTNISLHFYKFEDGVVKYRKLNIARRT